MTSDTVPQVRPSTAPHRLKSDSLRSLRVLRDEMMSTEYIDRLDDATPEVKRRSAQTLLAVQSAYLRLRNTKLAAVRDELVGNGAALEQGRTALEHTLNDLEDLHAFLDDVNHFLNIVGNVVAIMRP